MPTETPLQSNDSEWSTDQETVLERIRQNCILLSHLHRQNFLYLKSFVKYFRLPCIIIAGVNSIASVGLNAYVEQQTVSLLCCLLSLTTGIITSIEIYLQLNEQIESELSVSRDLYILAVDISKTLQLKRENRSVDGSAYLDSCLANYKKLFENSTVLTKKIPDKITMIPGLDQVSFSSDDSDKIEGV